MSKEKEQRLPPQSIESELAVLGCILIDPQSFPKVLHFINKDSFYKKLHSIIFIAMSISDLLTLRGGNILTTFSAALIVSSLLSCNF